MSINALLLLSVSTIRRPTKIRQNLASAIQNVSRTSGTLYIQIWKPNFADSSLSTTVPNQQTPAQTSVNILSRACSTIYSYASTQCPTVDVRFIVRVESQSPPRKPVSRVLGDNCLEQFETEIVEYARQNVFSSSHPACVTFLAPQGSEDSRAEDRDVDAGCLQKFDVVALGGTFDRMHNGHKILLTEAIIRCRKELIVGVTNEDMIKSKLLSEMVEPCDMRLHQVEDFVRDISPPLNIRVIPIGDPFGPTITEKDIDMIVVSQETIRGATKINEIRQSKNFPPLQVHAIELVAESQKESDHEEDKISSSSRRLRALGTRLRPPLAEPSLPYIIGLTGGTCSGKSTICQYLNSKGIATIDCDQLGHQAYSPGTACFEKIIEKFGDDILTDDKTQINRKKLGAKVFGDSAQLRKLTDIVWPEIRRLAWLQIQGFVKDGHKIIVLDAAVLLEANWNDMCHEVWVAFVPKEEAIRRIEERDKLSKEAAENRINAQLSNQQRLARATFAFCSMWDKEFTRAQVDKALSDINQIVNNRTTSSL